MYWVVLAFLFIEASKVVFVDDSSDVGPYDSRCVFPILHGWSIAVFRIHIDIICNPEWSRYFSYHVFMLGNKYGFIILSALFSSFAVFCRQTNIILSVLNPALILLLRVCFFFHFLLIPLVWIGLEEWEIREVWNTNHSFTFFDFLRIPIRSSSRYSVPRFIHFLRCVLREERIFGGIGRSRASFHVAPSNAALLLFCFLLPRVHRRHRSEVVSLHPPPRKDQQNAAWFVSFLFVFVFSVFVLLLISRSDSLRNSRLFIRLFAPIIATLFFTFLKISWLYFFLSFSSKITAFQVFLNSDLRGFAAWNGERASVERYELVGAGFWRSFCSDSCFFSFGWVWFDGVCECRFRYYSLPILFYICIVRPRTHPIISLTISLTLNLITAFLFFYRPFVWPDGSIARFMW